MEVPAWKSSLMKYRSKLRSVCHVGKFLPDLRQLLTATEYLRVQNKPDDVSRVDELVRILLTKEERHFEAFCSVLERNGYPLWAKLLKPKVAEASLKRHYSSPGKMTSTTVTTPDAKSEIPTAVSTEKIAARDGGTASQGGFSPPPQKSDEAADLKWDSEAFWASIVNLIQKLKGDCAVFGVLVVGETGTGKSTLINNLMGKKVVTEGDTLESQTATITKHELEVEGVQIALYDTPGLGDSRSNRDGEYLRKVEEILKSGAIHLVIYCLKLSETRMRASLIRTFQEYAKIGMNWEWTIITLTFADAVPVPYSEKKKPEFDEVQFFNNRLAEMRAYITKTLVERVGVVPEVASKIPCNPSTSDPNERLVNGDRWFVPFWLEVLELLSPGAAMQFLEMRANNIDDLKLSPKDEEKLTAIISTKIKDGARIGATAGAAVGGLGAGLLGGLVGAGIGAGIGSVVGGGVGLVKSLWRKLKK